MFFRAGVPLLLAISLAGCATYRAKPLATAPDLVQRVDALDLAVPSATPKAPPRRLDPAAGFTLDQIGLLAVLNDPALRTERGRLGLAQAGVTAASLLPNPQLGLGFGALISGPASTPSYTASLTEDVAALITYRPRVAAAQAELQSVNAALLWQEWQVAQAARVLAAQIYGADRDIACRRRALDLLAAELRAVTQATSAGNLGLAAEAPLVAATAQAQRALANAQLSELKSWQQLDALLGLAPSVRFTILPPHPAPPPQIAPLVASLPTRRPDLIALQLGYRAADQRLREALLGQFPALVFGASGTSDTSGVVSIGPQMTIGLPLFDRNQAAIATARASRALLHAQYQAELDTSAGTALSTARRIRVLWGDMARARRQAREARRLLRYAQQAYAQGNVDQRSLVDYQTTALDRELEAADYETRLVSDELALDVALGLGLPQTRLAPAGADGHQPE
jgi:outer membrane protein, heavy metal efflux system